MATTLLTSLISYYKLDETSGDATDVVGGYTLTNTGTMPYSAAKIRNGMAPAAGKYLSGSSIDPDSYNDGLSISLWASFVPGGAGTATDLITFAQAASWGGVGIYYELPSTNIWFRFGKGSSGADHNSGFHPSNNVWFHVVITHSGAGANKDIIYINGSPTSFTGYTLANN